MIEVAHDTNTPDVGARPAPSAQKLWATPVAVHVERDWAELATVRDGAEAVRESTTRFLEQAQSVMELPGGLRRWWNGSPQHEARMLEHQARAQLPLLLSGDELAAHARDLLVQAAEVLPRSDERVTVVADPLRARPRQPVCPVDVAHLARAVYDALDERHVQSRGFRNRLIRLIGLAVVGLAALLGGFSAGLIPLTVEGTSSRSAFIVAALCAVFGAVGALITGVPPLARAGGTWNPFSLPWYQMLLKFALGPIFAVVGVLMLEARMIPNVEFPMPLPDLLVWALVFGAAQQLVTGAVDSRVRGMVSGPGNPAESRPGSADRGGQTGRGKR